MLMEDDDDALSIISLLLLKGFMVACNEARLLFRWLAVDMVMLVFVWARDRVS